MIEGTVLKREGRGTVHRLGIATAVAMSAAAVACSDPLSLSALAGLYDITVFEATSIEDPTLHGNWIGPGVVMHFGIAEAGGFTLETNGLAGGGTMRIEGNAVTLTFTVGLSTPIVWSGTISRDGDTVTLDLDEGVQLPFSDPGDLVPVRLRIVMVRSLEGLN